MRLQVDYISKAVLLVEKTLESNSLEFVSFLDGSDAFCSNKILLNVEVPVNLENWVGSQDT
jgi:hypothetical protein